MKKTVKKAIAVIAAAAMLPVSGLAPITTAGAAESVVVKLNPAAASPFNNGEFEGWGTSMGWWGNRIGYSDTLAEEAARLFYSEDGLGLDIVRYNVGGGDDPTHNHVTRSDSKLPCFKASEDVAYNWDADYNQVNVLKKIKEQNADVHIEGYTNSPPWWMTNSKCSGGGVDAGENLDSSKYADFAAFVADVTEHFESEGLKFDSYSPMNEPSTQKKYWSANSPKQEGNHVTPGEHQSGIIDALAAEYDKRGIDTLIAGLDETSIDYSVSSFAALSETARNNLDRLDTHSYEGSKRAQLKQSAVDAGKNLWMSEVDGSWDALGIAGRILADVNGMQPTAWVLWDIVDCHKDANFKNPSGEASEANTSINPNGKLWGLAMANHDNETIELTQKYYGFGQFTKYIKPGMTIIESSSNTLAAYDKKTGDITIVAVNSTGNSVPTKFDLAAFSRVGKTAQPIRTSGTFETGEKWAELGTIGVSENKSFTADLKANSITTFVIEGDGEPVDYMIINGSGTIVAGVEYEYTASGSSETADAVTWSVSDEDIASVTADGKLTAKKGGSFILTATASDGTFTSMNITAVSSDEVITITNKKSGLGLETRSKGITSGTQLVQWVYRGLDTSAWSLSGTEDGHFNITNKNADMLLIANADQKPVISNSTDKADDSAKWDLVNHGGYYEIKNVMCQKSLNVSGQSVANGGNVILYAFGGGDNELWSVSTITDELEHVVPVEIDYSEKYADTDYTFVKNVDAATNDFADDLKGFAVTGFAGLGSDGNGESVLMPQNSLSNNSSTQRAGTAALTLEEPVTCGDTETVNLSFDMFTPNSLGDSDFVLSASNGKELVKIQVNDWGNKYSVTIGGETVETAGNGALYFKNNISDKEKESKIANGGHVEIYYTPSTGDVSVSVKGVTNTAAEQKYSGSVETGLDIGKIYFAGTYTQWNKIMVVDNLVTNIIAEPEASVKLKAAAANATPPSEVTENIDIKPSQTVAVNKFTAGADGVSYMYTVSPEIKDCDVYFAVYGSDGELKAVTVNEYTKTIEGNFADCTFKLMLWKDMQPVCDAVTAVSDTVIAVWSSSDEAVISKDGVVTRGEEDKKVTLKAVFKYGEETLTKEYKVTVKAEGSEIVKPIDPVVPAEDDMQAYLFVHFVGTESNAESEQIYFSVSKDGTNWQTINSGKPVLSSSVGEMGVRDPHIVRSPDGNKFFLIATDLSIYNRRGDSNRWGTCQTSGSQSIVIWESDDLVNWSEARLVKVAVDNAGCTWAPESVYDDEKQSYMVFWASKVSDDDYTVQRIYRSYTTDFVSFTEPEVYMDGDTVSNIDTTFIKYNGVYYRFTKNESNSSVIMEKSTSLDGSFEAVSEYTIDGVAGNTVQGYEGPTAYKINGEDKWCLLLDYYSKSAGYKPFMTDDITKGMFTSASSFNFDTKYRHGTVMPITQEEYDALMKKYTVSEEGETGEMIFSLDFDNENAEPALGTAKVNGEITYTEGFNGGKAAVLDGTDFIEISGADNTNLLAGLETFTVSFASKTNAQSWWFYAAPDTTSQTYKSEKYAGVLDSGSKLTCERYNSNNIDRPAAAAGAYTSGEWKHVTLVNNKNTVSLYVNGEKLSAVESSAAVKEMLGDNPVVYIGKANWGSGEYSDGAIDDFKVYNYAMGEEDVKAAYAALTANDTSTE